MERKGELKLTSFLLLRAMTFDNYLILFDFIVISHVIYILYLINFNKKPNLIN